MKISELPALQDKYIIDFCCPGCGNAMRITRIMDRRTWQDESGQSDKFIYFGRMVNTAYCPECSIFYHFTEQWKYVTHADFKHR